MRFALTSVLSLVVVFASLQAHAQGTSMGGFVCRQAPMPCEVGDPGFPSQQKLLTVANSCVSQNMNLSSPDGFFDSLAGLDANGCFSTNIGAFPGTDGLRSIPQCCIKKSLTNTCYVYCDLVSH